MNNKDLNADIHDTLRSMERVMPMALMAGDDSFEQLCGLYASTYLLTFRIPKDTSC